MLAVITEYKIRNKKEPILPPTPSHQSIKQASSSHLRMVLEDGCLSSEGSRVKAVDAAVRVVCVRHVLFKIHHFLD